VTWRAEFVRHVPRLTRGLKTRQSDRGQRLTFSQYKSAVINL